jgi:uncharacterized protein
MPSSPACGRGAWLTILALLFLAAPALAAPKFPPLSGRVVDAANILPPATEASIDAKLAGLEAQTGNQVVVATVASLQGYEIEEYGYQLGRAWGIGREKQDDGVILLVAPNERRVRIEVGYGLEPVLTDALTSVIVRSRILPAFRAGNMAAGIETGVDAIVDQLELPPDQARANAARAADAQRQAAQSSGPGPGAFFWLAIVAFWLFASMARRRGGRRYRRRGWGAPVIIWGPGMGGWGGGGFGGGGGLGGGGFGGGGGSFGGGGASGDW